MQSGAQQVGAGQQEPQEFAQGRPQHCWPQEIGQQPLQVIVPKHAGVKALYWRQQIVAQQSQQHLWKKNTALAEPVFRLSRATLRQARVSSFFMV
jgi:hypothetical protein